MTSSAVGVTKALAGGEGVADQLLELLDVGEAAAIVAGPEHGGADAHLEDAAGAGHERDLADLRLERRQQLLRHPRRPQQPAALRAVLDLDTRTRLHGHDPAYRGPRIDADVTALPRSAQGGEDLFGDDLDLRGLVAIGDEDQAVDARGHVGAQLLDALLHAAADGVLDRRLAPRRDVPLGRLPVAHRRLGLGARRADTESACAHGTWVRVEPRGDASRRRRKSSVSARLRNSVASEAIEHRLGGKRVVEHLASGDASRLSDLVVHPARVLRRSRCSVRLDAAFEAGRLHLAGSLDTLRHLPLPLT